MSGALLSVRDLSVTLGSGSRAVGLVKDVSFDLARGQILSIVGESGSGKSMTSKALMGLLPPKVTATGQAVFRGANLLDKGVLPPRGTGIGLIFQEPMTALNSTLVSYTLMATPAGTRLTVSETGFATLPKALREAYLRENNNGWDVELAELKQYCAGLTT